LPAAGLRRLPPGALHLRSRQDGSLRERGMGAHPGLHDLRHHRLPQRLDAAADLPRMAGLMYRRILVPLECSSYDEAILEHVARLARLTDASLFLIHLADGGGA